MFAIQIYDKALVSTTLKKSYNSIKRREIIQFKNGKISEH